jgi:hypothetical protein
MGTKHRIRGLVAFVLLSAVVGFAMPSAFAGTTTTTVSPATIAAGRAYASKLLNEQAVPRGAILVNHFTNQLSMQSQPSISIGLQTATRRYLLASGFDLVTFVRGHLRKGEAVTGTGSGGGPNERPTQSVSVSLPCHSPHVTFCGLDYATTVVKSGRTELRIDLQVDWLPISNVKMPTTGVVSLTGYGDTSLPRGSSDPFTVVLTHQQALALRVAISKLKNSGGGTCHEDELLLKISVTSGTSTSVQWKATADVCPGVLKISSPEGSAQLDDHNCALWQLVRSFFPAGDADATKGAIGFCGE